MKKIIIAGIAIMFAGSGAFAAPSAANDKTLEADKAAASAARREARFEKLDASKDGAISKDEWFAQAKERADKRFATLDTNHDGKLSKAEIAAGARGGHRKMANTKMGTAGDMKPTAVSTAPTTPAPATTTAPTTTPAVQ